MIHSIAWMIWLLVVMVFILSTRNPVYLCLILVGLLILGQRLAREKKIKNWVLANLRFLLAMILLSMLINGIFSHVGQTILFTIPQKWPLIGGNFTVESLVYGAINGLVIGALYILFNVINLALSIKQLTRLIPRAFHPIAMMVTISLTFFPSIQKRAREIKEAQMIRGNPMKKIVDWLPIFIPLLVTSLENAFLLAESMTTRGFHQPIDLKAPGNLISLILGAFFVFSGWILHLFNYPRYLSAPLFVIGFGLILLMLITVGKHSKITRYHLEEWKPMDIMITIVIVLYLAFFIYLRWVDGMPSLNYSPYPYLSIPVLQTIGLSFCILPFLPMIIKRHD
jgi:energy-coupling factor transport system permease protein